MEIHHLVKISIFQNIYIYISKLHNILDEINYLFPLSNEKKSQDNILNMKSNLAERKIRNEARKK